LAALRLVTKTKKPLSSYTDLFRAQLR